MRPGEARVQSGSDTRKVQTFFGEVITSEHKHGHDGDPGTEAVRGGAANPQAGGGDREDEAEKVSWHIYMEKIWIKDFRSPVIMSLFENMKLSTDQIYEIVKLFNSNPARN